MIKRTLEISQHPAHLCVRNRQLLLRRDEEIVGSVPAEDIGVVLVDHPQATYSHAALMSLAEQGAALVICGKDHLPSAIMLPIADHGEGVWRIGDQINASLPLKKRLWQQVIIAKIHAQSQNLSGDSPGRRRLEVLAGQVRSGDPSNIEAQAAKVYWKHWLEDTDHAAASFSRDPDGDGINACLNYGYAVIRAAVGRAIVAAGLTASLGIFHQNRSNAFCLADDLMEPYRPLVDRTVRNLLTQAPCELTDLSQPIKAQLLKLLTHPMTLKAGTETSTGPMMVMLHRLVASLVRCYRGEQKRLEIPTAIAEPGTGSVSSCGLLGTE